MRSFSLVIPTYNNLSTLPQTLGSVLRLENKDAVQLIVSDDASTDGTTAFLHSWFSEHSIAFSQAQLLIGKSNVGISGNHARAFTAVKADYALYIGGDDLISNPSLFSDIDASLKTIRAVAIAKLDVEALYKSDGSKVRIYRHKSSFFRLSSRQQFAALALYGNFLYAGPGTLLHVPTMRQIGAGFDTRFRTFEDLPLFMSFLTAGHRMRFIPVKGVVWVRTAGSLSLNGFAGIRDRFDQENEMIRDLVESHVSLLSFKERLLYRAKRLPKYLRYIVFASSVSWLRLRLVPSLVKKAHAIVNR